MSAKILCVPNEEDTDYRSLRNVAMGEGHGDTCDQHEQAASSKHSKFYKRSMRLLRRKASRKLQNNERTEETISKSTVKQMPTTMVPHPANRIFSRLHLPHLLKSSSVPQMWDYSSNHILINQERARRDISTLVRSSELDEASRKQATLMATNKKLLHSDKSKLAERATVKQRFAENVACGKSIRHVHSKMMKSHNERVNILNPNFTTMGIGTAKDSSGRLYVCQLLIG